jgi:hypothetical protein
MGEATFEQVLEWGRAAAEDGTDGGAAAVADIIRTAGGAIPSGSAECILDNAKEIAFDFNLINLMLQGAVVAIREEEDADFKFKAVLSPSDLGNDILRLTEKGWRSRVRAVPSRD